MLVPQVSVVKDTGLGNSTYLVDLGEGRGLAVDAPRDLRALHQAATERGLRITFAADTHLHADFLSGAVQLAAHEGTQLLAPRRGGREFEHRGLAEGDEVDLGGLTLRALETPGHTTEHLSYVLLDGAHEIGVFTGGSLLNGWAARVDLVAPERTEELARDQYRSVRRLAALHDAAALWPTHGGGSFCSTAASSAGEPSTIGAERASNPLLQLDEEDFVRQLLASQGSFPPYFLRLSEANRRGPRLLDSAPTLDPLEPVDAAEAIAHGALLVDVRPIDSFAATHPVGALSIPLRPAFASWLGWLASVDRPILILREEDQDPDEILWQALKIGYENLAGEIRGGIEEWTSAGLPVTSLELIDAGEASGLRVLDIRQKAEFAAGHLPGSRNIELGDLTSRVDHLADEPMVMMCGHGERAMGAASILSNAGFSHVSVLQGGPEELAAARGVDLETGP